MGKKDFVKLMIVPVICIVVIVVLAVSLVKNRKAGAIDTEGTTTVTETAVAAATTETEAETEPAEVIVLSDDGENKGEDAADGQDETIGFGDPLSGQFNNSKKALVELAVTYNKKIPFCVGGIDESNTNGYYVSPGGVDNYKLGEYLKHGMSSQGYVIWLFRNTFSSAPAEFLDLVTAYKNGNQQTVATLEIGDIGLLTDDPWEANHYGVCVGFIDGVPLFSHCGPYPTKDYPMGTTHISFLKSARDSFYNGSAPVEFTCFYRPSLLYSDREEGE